LAHTHRIFKFRETFRQWFANIYANFHSDIFTLRKAVSKLLKPLSFHILRPVNIAKNLSCIKSKTLVVKFLPVT